MFAKLAKPCTLVSAKKTESGFSEDWQHFEDLEAMFTVIDCKFQRSVWIVLAPDGILYEGMGHSFEVIDL